MTSSSALRNDDEIREAILDPELPIVDPHHHLALIPGQLRYLLDELLGNTNTGHNVRATVFIEAHTMYRAVGPESMKSVGERKLRAY